MDEEKIALEENITSEETEVVAEKKQDLKRNQKKRNPKKLGFIALAVVLILIVCMTQSSRIANGMAKLFMSPQKYYQHIEEKTVETMVNWVATAYSDIMQANAELFNQRMNLDVSLGLEDDAIDLLNAFTYEEFDFLKDFGFKVEMNSKDDTLQMMMELDTAGEAFVSGNVLVDLEKEMLYAQVPQLEKSYLSINLDDLLEMLYMDDMEASEIREKMKAWTENYKNMPQGKKLEKLLNKYFGLALSCIEDVEEEKSNLNINDVSMDCTKISISIDEETMQTMLELLLETMEDDAELEEFIVELASFSQGEIDGDDLYDNCSELISDLLDEIEYISFDDELEMTVWVDKSGAICGRSVKIPMDFYYYSNIEASYAVARDGKNVGIEVEAEYEGTKVRVNGTAKVKNQKLNGELDVRVAGLKLAKISFSEVKASANALQGVFLITPQKSMIELVEDEIGINLPIDFSDLGLKLELDTTMKKGSVMASLLLEEEVLAFINTVAERTNGTSISAPKEKECVLIEEEDDLWDYIEDVDLDELLEELEDIGITDNLLSELYWLLYW